MKSDFKNKEKNFYTSYSKLSEVRLVTIGYATSFCIKKWAEKTLPNGKIFGEVLNANTLHYKTFKPQKGGLFCERIFGPLKDFQCACGKPLKYKKNILKKIPEQSPKEGLLSIIASGRGALKKSLGQSRLSLVERKQKPGEPIFVSSQREETEKELRNLLKSTPFQGEFATSTSTSGTCKCKSSVRALSKFISSSITKMRAIFIYHLC